MEYHSHTCVGTELCGENFTASIKLKNLLTTQHRNSSLGINIQKYSPKYTAIYVNEVQCGITCYRKRNICSRELAK